MPTTERPLRLCDVCGGLDDHPRHVQALPPGSTEGKPSGDTLVDFTNGREIPAAAIVQFADGAVLCRHMDCCAAAGCEICAATEQEHGQRRGQELIDHLDAVRGG